MADPPTIANYTPSHFRALLATFRQSDCERDEVVTDLIQRYEDLDNKFNKINIDYEMQGSVLRDQYNEAKKLKSMVNKLHRDIVRYLTGKFQFWECWHTYWIPIL